MNKNWEREQIDRLVHYKKIKITELQAQIRTLQQRTRIMIIMIAAAKKRTWKKQ
jgi:hypothetical protein